MSVHVELEIGESLKDNIGTYFCNEKTCSKGMHVKTGIGQETQSCTD